MYEEPGHVTLAQARDHLERVKRAHEAGCLDETAAALRSGPSRGKTVRELAEGFYKLRILPKRSGPQEVRRTLDSDILPAIGEKALRAVTKEDCRDIVLGVVKRGSPSQAGKVFDHLREFFGWVQGFGEDLPVDPMAVLDKDALGVENNARDRFLTEEEIPLYWHALKKPGLNGRGLSCQVQLALRVLLLVPERTGELMKGEWREVDFGEAVWTVPVAHQKLNPKVKRPKPWRVPLAPQVLEIFREMKEIAGASPFILASDAKTGRLNDKALIQALTGLQETERQKDGKRIPVTPLLDLPGGHLTVHDLRHTFRTVAVDKLGVLPFIAERCLHHSQGKTEGRYDHYDYLKERRAALELWGKYVQRLVEPHAAKVASLEMAARHPIA